MSALSSKYTNLEPEWVFFGGTFDPPHVGHLEAVRLARDYFVNAEIVLVPSFAPPVSKGVIKDVATPFADRVAMSVIAFDEWERVQVSSLEEDLEAPSYTIKTLRDLKAEYPASRLAWMIGADQLASFTQWFEPREILEVASLVIVPRPAQSRSELMDLASSVATSLGFKTSVDRDAGVVLLDGGHPLFVLDQAPPDVSSTEIRAAIAAKENCEAMVPASVLAYVNELELYQLER